MLCEEGLCKVYEVGNDAVVCICPEGRELKAVTRLFLLRLVRICVFDVIETCRVGVVLSIRTVGDNEYLREQNCGKIGA